VRAWAERPCVSGARCWIQTLAEPAEFTRTATDTHDDVIGSHNMTNMIVVRSDVAAVGTLPSALGSVPLSVKHVQSLPRVAYDWRDRWQYPSPKAL